MKSEASAKFVVLIRATENTPERPMAHDVPFTRRGMAVVATKTISTPADAMKPPMTTNTGRNQCSRPGAAVRVSAMEVPK